MNINRLESWLLNFEVLKEHVETIGQFPNKYIKLNNWCRYQRKCINAGRDASRTKSTIR
jgi:hypothetical protein